MTTETATPGQQWDAMAEADRLFDEVLLVAVDEIGRFDAAAALQRAHDVGAAGAQARVLAECRASLDFVDKSVWEGIEANLAAARDDERECPTCGTECHCGEDDPQAGECPGCGGPCQTACR